MFKQMIYILYQVFITETEIKRSKCASKLVVQAYQHTNINQYCTVLFYVICIP